MIFQSDKNTGDVCQTRIKKLASTAILLIIVLSLFTAVVVYTVDSTGGGVVPDTVYSDNSANKIQAFVDALYRNAPQYKPERVSYSAYKIHVGENIGEVTISTQINGDKLKLTVRYPNAAAYLDFLVEDTSMISTYIDDIKAETNRLKHEDMAEAFAVILCAASGYDMTVDEREDLIKAFNKAAVEDTASVLKIGEATVEVFSDDEEGTVCTTIIL